MAQGANTLKYTNAVATASKNTIFDSEIKHLTPFEQTEELTLIMLNLILHIFVYAVFFIASKQQYFGKFSAHSICSLMS